MKFAPQRQAGAAALLIATMSLLAGGCSPTTAKLNVNVALDRSLTTGGYPPSTTVQLVGLTRDEVESDDTWATYPVNRYFRPGDTLKGGKAKNGLLHEINLGTGGTSALLSNKDPIWDRWKAAGVWYLAIVSSYPRLGEEPNPPSADPRRKILPLDSRAWPGKQVSVTISESAGVTYEPAPKPIKD
jgi:hypothetical protein